MKFLKIHVDLTCYTGSMYNGNTWQHKMNYLAKCSHTVQQKQSINDSHVSHVSQAYIFNMNALLLLEQGLNMCL